ncbi:MATE family efflux transporter [Holdemania massiliensis]|uniref:MATE family efflux transporter n=1 Tax=Holdemania massiliensis TaxID=1468449 RepID=UPI0026772D74|nr:MATE family efflux transporter [Holdemania massiliensis]
MEFQTHKMSLFHYTWPIFIELLLQMLVGNVDQMMMSQVSQNAVAAIGNANQIVNVLIITFSVISLAMTILVTQYFGSGNPERVSETYSLALAVNFGFGLVISAALVFFNMSIFNWMRVPVEILHDGSVYITIIGLGMIFQALFMTYIAMFRTQGWMKQTMAVSALMNVLNIVGNFIFIRGWGIIPPLGIAGVAISSTVSRLIGLGLLIVMFNLRSTIAVSLRTLTPFPWKQLKKLLAIGVPSGGESVSYNLSQMVITKIVNGFGTAVINTRVYANMFAMVSYMYGSAVSQAAQILVGILIGGRKLEEAHKQVMRTLVYSLIIGVGVSVLLYCFSDELFGLFTQDPTVLLLGKQVMFIEIFLEAGRAVNMTQVRALQAAGDIQFPILLGIASQWGVAVALSYLLAVTFKLGVVGVWLAMMIDEVLRAILFLMRWYSGKWKKQNLIEN